MISVLIQNVKNFGQNYFNLEKVSIFAAALLL